MAVAVAEPTYKEILKHFAPDIEAIAPMDGRNNINSVDKFVPDDGREVLLLIRDSQGYERSKVTTFENGLWRGCWPLSATLVAWQELPGWR